MFHASRIRDIERPPTCVRCGVRVNKPRPNAQCADCRYTTDFEATAARRGLDLAALGEDEFLVLAKNHTTVVNERAA